MYYDDVLMYKPKKVCSVLFCSVCLPEKVGWVPLAVVIITTANGAQPTFSGRHIQLFIISYLYGVLTEFAELYIDITRSILKSISPCLLKAGGSLVI